MGLIKQARKLQDRAEKTYLDYDKLLTREERELLEQIKKGRNH